MSGTAVNSRNVMVTYNAGYKECPEGVLCRMLDLMRIPEGNLSFQVVRHLFGLFTASTFKALIPGLDSSGWRCVLGVLEKVQETSDAQVAWKESLSMSNTALTRLGLPTYHATFFHGAIYPAAARRGALLVAQTMPAGLAVGTASFWECWNSHRSSYGDFCIA